MNPFAALTTLLTTSTPQNYTITEVPTQAAALTEAQHWANLDPKLHSWTTVASTGSMQDKFDNNSLALLTKSDGSDIKKGDLILYDNGLNNGGTISHEVAELNDTHFIGNGTQNKHYDGWRPRSLIRWKANIVKWPAPKQP